MWLGKVIFFQKNPSLKEVYFCFVLFIFFFSKNPNLKKKLGGGGGGGGRGLEKVNFFLQRIQGRK